MSVNDTEFDFDEYDKPGAERSRRRRGEDDDIESDLEEELLGDDGWTSSKKPSEMSDEELNDDLLQSDDEDQNISMGTSYGQQEEENYADDTVTLGAPGYEGEGEYTEDYSHDHNADQMDYTGEPVEGDDGYQDEVLDLEINEPLDGEFQDDEYTTSYNEKPLDERHDQGSEVPEEEEFVEDEVSSTAESSQVESEAVLEEESREESEEEDEEDEESGRLRFKSERKEGVVVRLADAGRKRSNIPETLELSEKAKADLREFEEQEEKKRQNRYGRGRGGRGGRGRGGMLGYGPQDMRGNRRRMNEPRYPFMGNMNMQHQGSRMPPHQQHHSRPRGPPPFSEPGRPLVQQPLQPLMPPHMAHRSPPMHSQMEPPPRMMSPSPPGFPQHSHPQPPPPQPKNIHINPHFRGPSTPVQVPLMPPAQSQPRPAVGPPRFPGQGDFQQHTFGAPQRPPPHMEPYRSQPPLGPQDREPLFMGEHADSAPFPGQPMFEHHGPSPLMNANIHPPQMPGPGHMSFGPPGPAFNQPGHGPLGLFQREPPRPGLPANHGQGMMGLNQGGPPNQPRQFMGPRQPFGQPRNHFNLQIPYRMQPPHPQDLAHPPHAAHAQQHHHQQPPNEPRPMMHSGQNSFHPQQAHGSPRQSTPRSQNPQLRNMANRQRMTTPTPKQVQTLPQRNSNLREVPVAPGNANINSTRPAAAANVNPTTPAAMGLRSGQNSHLSNSGRGRGQASARGRGASQPGGPGRTQNYQESNTEPDTGTQNVEEDEETRQYRLKIEEQKRLREEILRRKEMRRQMQAGVRKKELLDRLNSNPQSQNQGTAPPQNPPSQPHPPVQQTPQQRPMPPRQQPANQGVPFSSNGSSKTPKASPPVRTRGPMVMGTNQHPHTGISAEQPQTPQVALQQKRSAAPQNPVRAVPSSVLPPAPRPGAKRTVMQRATDAAPVPQKVRLIKLSATGEKSSAVTGVPMKEEGTQSASPHNLGAQRKVTVATLQQQGSNVPQQQNRVVVSGRGRGRGQTGAGRPLPTRQSQKAAEKGPSTVSIEGLSSSTTEVQLKNLLKSIGPIEMFKMIPQHRKAIARFSSPQHAASFQTSFHRHMIDLSHIDVSLIDG
ncbi:RNA-binding protein 33 isoform X2 [Boleophthalmus pectinirostris]|uniref:RNA-binding protein 33 isoform X2 n=1 Tax=Boleophthalmus pectinirostris TaxID=150288 RepID=UPI00242A3989|nr:RNA-binding protein 33 isoform X2 [Boleophthalmus pectinirostris]